VLVPGSDFKSDEECGNAVLAGSIPVRFRQVPSDPAILLDRMRAREEALNATRLGALERLGCVRAPSVP
jgi:hypothetical protein